MSRVFAFPGDGIGEFDGALGEAEREGTASTTSGRPTKRSAR